MSSAEIFTTAFLQATADQIKDAVRTDGFYSLPNGLQNDFVDAMNGEVARHSFGVNRNWVTGVYSHRQYYLNHMMACSPSFVRMITDPFLLDTFEAMLGDQMRLKAMRYYETYGRHHMQWHTDNKTVRGKIPTPGLIMVAYLADVEDGEFQYVRGSQQWSGENAYSDYSEDLIERKYAADVVSFRGPKGTVVIYDTYGIHRARPVDKRSFVRKSLFFQVDAHAHGAEPMLVNPSFLTRTDPRTLRYLGFGQASSNDLFPSTDLGSLPLTRLGAGELLGWVGKRTARFGYDNAPSSLRKSVRGLLGKS